MITFDALGDDEVLAGLVGDVDTFAERHWGKRPLRRSAGAPWATMLSIADVEGLMLTGARVPTFRLVRHGERLAPEEGSRPVRLAGQVVDGVADPERIARALADGATLVAQSLETTSLTISRLCRALERATSHRVQANAYLTPPGAVGLSSHRDDHDVLVVQQSGTKTWSVDGIDGEVALTPGDVLYLPTGTTHSAQAQASASLHLTIGLMTRSWAALVRGLIDTLDDLRAPLPLAYAQEDGADAFAARVGEVLRSVGKQIADTDPRDVVRRETRSAITRRRPLLDGHLADVLSANEIGLDTVVRRRCDQRAHLADDGARVEVVMRDRRISFPAVGRAALQRILTGEPVRVGELPGIDDDSKLVVVRRLVHAALLRTGER